MALVLIKNNLKLMLRSKWILCLMVIMPLIVMGVLSSVFNDMLNDDYTFDNLNVAYSISLNGEMQTEGFREAWDAFRKGCEENDIFLTEYEGTFYPDLLDQDDVDIFLKIDNDKVEIFQTKENNIAAGVLGSALSAFELNYQGAMMLQEYLTSHPGSVADFQQAVSGESSSIRAEKLEVNPIPTAMDYYGIIEVVYFAWCGMVSLSVVISGERKNKIESRMQTAPVSKLALYMGKMIPCFLATAVEVGVTVFLSVLLYDVHWGRPLLSAVIVLLLCLASAAVGVLLFYLFNSVVISIVAGYLSLMVIGFLGGTFNMYMYAYPEQIEKLSIQYYINRTLVEFTTMGESTYMKGCFLFLAGVIGFSIVTGMLVMNRKMEKA